MAGGYLSGMMGRGRGAMPEDQAMDTGEFVDRSNAYAENLPPRGRELMGRTHGPATRAITRSREMRGLEDGTSDVLTPQLSRIMDSMRARASRSGVDPNDDAAVLAWAEQNDPTDSTMEAVAEIRRQFRGSSGGSDNAWYPGRR